jgi:SAM-dependent methyltransferase
MMNQTLPPDEFNYDEVFEADDYLYFYRQYLTDERSDEEVQSLVKLAALDRPMKILDLACGFGRHSNRLAALGHDVTGIDLSYDFLDIARKNAEDQNLRLSYIRGDMRKIDYQEEFNRVLLLFTAFGYFDDETNFLVLMNAHKALKPGGLFIFDILNRDAVLKYMLAFYVTEIGNDLMIDRVSFDPITGRQKNGRIVIRDGIRKDKPFSIRMYNANEMANLLLRSGFQNIQFFGSWDGMQLNADARRMIVVAEK